MHFLVGEPPVSRPVLKPYGVSFHHGVVSTCDTVSRGIARFDLLNRRLDRFVPGGDGTLDVPVGIAVDTQGVCYVTDARAGRVRMYSPGDRYLGTLKTEGTSRPAGVAVAGDRLYVTDLARHRAEVYHRLTRELLFTIPRDPGPQAGRLFSPTNIAVDSRGRIYVSDAGAFRVQQYDVDGTFLRSIGGPGEAPGQFARPKGVALDRADRMYVVDAATQIVQIFDDRGRLLTWFGEGGRGAPALNLPAGIAIDYDHVDLFTEYIDPGFEVSHLVLVSNQYGDHKINVYGIGNPK
jgi:sugar lactone lactonase YvrE